MPATCTLLSALGCGKNSVFDLARSAAAAVNFTTRGASEVSVAGALGFLLASRANEFDWGARVCPERSVYKSIDDIYIGP